VKLKELGAVIVDPVKYPDFLIQAKEGLSSVIMQSEFKTQITTYLKTVKPGFPKTFDELVERANDPKTGYRSPEKAFALKYSASVALDLDDPVYLAAKNEGLAMVRATFMALFTKYKLDAIIYPTVPRPATPIALGSGSAAGPSATSFANQTGFPDLIVPAGMTKDGLPVTLSFFGPAFSEPKLLGYGYDFEQATQALTLPKTTPPLLGDVIAY
jgi:amidase